jgi:hypothetical protein
MMKAKKDCAEPRSTIPKMKEEKGMMHGRVYPGQHAMTSGGSPYDGKKAAPMGHSMKGLPTLLASRDPLAIRTSGFE